MTLHNAKGLEYPIVFVAGCEEGVFPHQRALDEGGIEEERRLFYVAVTRAMRELYLTYARRRSVFGASTYGLASRFLDEIPAELCEREELPVLRPRGVGIGAAVGTGAGGFAGMGARGGGDWASASRSAGPVVSYRLGDDIVHAAFGEGVVTGVEPGGIIVVRFAGDGSRAQVDGRLRPRVTAGIDIGIPISGMTGPHAAPSRTAHVRSGRPAHAPAGYRGLQKRMRSGHVAPTCYRGS